MNPHKLTMLAAVSQAALVLGCAAKAPQPPPQVAAAPEEIEVPPRSDEQRCAEAARLRSEGYKLLGELKLSKARRAYMASLELDPGNNGARVQLDVIDALAEDRQVGTSQAAHGSYSAVVASPCAKQAMAAAGNVPSPLRLKVIAKGQAMSVAKGDAKANDVLAPAELTRVFEQALPTFNACYQSAAPTPQLRGEMTINVSVLPDGKVEHVALENNTLYEATVEQCVAQAAAKLVFPRRRSTITLNAFFPLLFGASAGESGR